MRVLIEIATFLFLSHSASASAAELSELSQSARAATFEFVVPKETRDPLTYAKPLPLDRLPYSERTDRYRSIGTAFAVGENTFVTAAHVLAAVIGSQNGSPAIRSSDGTVYQIKTITKYSSEQDYAVFTVEGGAKTELQPASGPPALDESVFAVGNALGEGIVIRSGTLNSMTPEERDGRWKWIRFSAPVSPGNSGGPLLDKSGKVIGVVTAASVDQSLNYALPIELVLNGQAIASVDFKEPFSLAVMNEEMQTDLHRTTSLPMPIAKFRQWHENTFSDLYLNQQKKFLASHAHELFPNGSSERALTTVSVSTVPSLVTQGADGSWQTESTADAHYAALPDGGEMAVHLVNGITLIAVRRGSSEVRLPDVKAAADYLLSGLALPRYVGQEAIPITSFGAPISDEPYRDRYGRKWRQAAWVIPFADEVAVMLLLPTPNGFVGMLAMVPTGSETSIKAEQRFLADFLYLTYMGSIREWRRFLKSPELIPDSLHNVELSFAPDSGFHYKSQRLELNWHPWPMKLSEEGVVQLRMAYMKDGRQVVWDVGGVLLQEGQNENYVYAIRHAKPSAQAPKDLVAQWQDMMNGEGNFSPARSYNAKQRALWRCNVLSATSNQPKKQDEASAMYELQSYVQGQALPIEVDAMQKAIVQGTRVLEP